MEFLEINFTSKLILFMTIYHDFLFYLLQVDFLNSSTLSSVPSSLSFLIALQIRPTYVSWHMQPESKIYEILFQWSLHWTNRAATQGTAALQMRSRCPRAWGCLGISTQVLCPPSTLYSSMLPAPAGPLAGQVLSEAELKSISLGDCTCPVWYLSMCKRKPEGHMVDAYYRKASFLKREREREQVVILQTP